MKKIVLLIAVIAVFAHCNNKKEDKPETKAEEKKADDSITYPFTAAYSSDMSMGDPNHAKIVLDFIKSFEERRFTDMRALMADTFAIDLADGNKYRGTADSAMKMVQRVTDMYASARITIDAWMPIHSNDRNEDFVLVWERDYYTGKGGHMDSLGYHNVYQVKNNKISYCAEFQMKLKPEEDNK